MEKIKKPLGVTLQNADIKHACKVQMLRNDPATTQLGRQQKEYENQLLTGLNVCVVSPYISL